MVRMMDEHDNNGIAVGTGVSLRDYFAAAAMQGWMSSWPDSSPHPANHPNGAKDIAKLSYKMADAMIAERQATEMRCSERGAE